MVAELSTIASLVQAGVKTDSSSVALWNEASAFLQTWQGQGWLVLLILTALARTPWLYRAEGAFSKAMRYIIFVTSALFFWSTLVGLFYIANQTMPPNFQATGVWPRIVTFLFVPIALLLSAIYVLSEKREKEDRRQPARS